MGSKSVFAGMTLLLATAFPCSALELELQAGVFTYDNSFGIDYVAPKMSGPESIQEYPEQKLKYPFVSVAPGQDVFLLFLAVHDDQYRLHAYRLKDLMDGGLAANPVRTRPDSWRGTDLFAEPPPRIRAFFRGGAFLETDDDGPAVLLRVSDAKEILKDDSVRDYGKWEKRWAYVGSRGLVVDGGKKPFFECREVFSVDYDGDGVFAIGYQDDDQTPRVCLRREPAGEKCGCEPLSAQPELDPRFSGDGRLLATAAKNQGSWDLRVYAVASTSGVPKTKLLRSVPDVDYYDITTESFAYPGSYGWADGRLYFKRKLRSRSQADAEQEAREGRTVHRISCAEGATSCELESLRAPGCVRLRKPTSEVGRELAWLAAETRRCQGEPSRPALEVDVKEIVWAQPYHYDGETYLAAEAIVRPNHEQKYKQGKWFSRILIFRVK